MSDMQRNAIEVDTRVIRRGMFAVIIGSVLSMIGIVMASTELTSAVRRYIQQMETPPSELAKQGFAQARLAATAGAAGAAEAWRQANAPHARASSNGGSLKAPAQTGG
jgi:hypothetical protein